MAYTTEELGLLIARAHYQAWRLDAPPFDLTPEELAAIMPNLIKSGSAGIVWHRVKPFRERYGAMAYALEAATQVQIEHNQKVEEAIVECVTRLRAYGIEPVLVKGLALAKLYPEGIVRPAGDIDLVVRKEEFAAAQAILHDSSRDSIPVAIDLKHPDNWDEAPNDSFPSRLQMLRLNDASVSVMSPTDTTIASCFHFMKHGGQRPLWLSELGLTYEHTKSPVLQWPGLSTTGDSWLKATLTLVHHLVGVSVRANDGQCFLDWMQNVVFEQWQNPIPVGRKSAFTSFFHDPASLPDILAEAWPTPLSATFFQQVPISSRRPIQAQRREYLSEIRIHLRHRLVSQIRSIR